jgi:membrane-bound lytic murein transglycosylase B
MKKLLKSMRCVFFAGLILSAIPVHAQDEDFKKWQEEFKIRALKEGILEKTLNHYMPKMLLQERVIATDTKKPEYIRNFWDYIAPRLTEEKVQNAQKMKNTYATWLNRVSKNYHVPKEYLLALWSMETNFGSFMGKTPLLDSLGSLAYHPRRREFFTKELLAYFRILESEPYPPELGAWDGGIGNFQFMPTTFMAYAVDADSNGTKSLTGSIPDSLASAANYLHQMGWQEAEPWGRQVILPPNFDYSLIGETKYVDEWQKLGVQMTTHKAFSESEKVISAKLRAPMGADGPFFLTYPNFKLLNRWNKLELYAITTGILADMIAGRRQAPIRPKDFEPLKTEELQKLQQILLDKGYYADAVDGLLGTNMRKAIRMFQRDNNMMIDGYPNSEVLTKLNIHNKEEKYE